MQEKDANRLLEKFRAGHCTEEEKIRLRNWFHSLNLQVPTDLTEEELEDIGADMWASLDAQTRPTKRLWPRLAVAASIAAILATGAYVFFQKEQPQLVAQKHDVAPAHQQATLTLANGKKIVLTKGLSGQLAQQGSTTIKVNPKAEIAYQSGSAETTITYNTLTTKKGEQSPYPLVLADGTKVWLNAASSITFPTAFNSKERVVKMTGEAYFEVAHDANYPFKVETGSQTIEDIGTAFDIKAYAEEPNTKTALISGSVKITTESSNKTLTPGELATGNDLKIQKDVNLKVITSWKDGYFRFEETDLHTIMREFARWYDLDISYGHETEGTFKMKVSRQTTLNQALKILVKGGVNYKLDGKKLIINP